MIPFSKPYIPKKSFEYLANSMASGRISGDHIYTERCTAFLTKHLGSPKRVLLTTSCTHSLEMSALLLNIQPGDEVICPSFTFSSSANAFALRGAKLKFVDIEPQTMNVTAELIQQAITKKTKAVCVVHYAGIACDMEPIQNLLKNTEIALIEDAAQALGSDYNGKPLGTFGEFGCLSFHETKNITCGEGGALIVNDAEYSLRAEILREKGTNRAQFFRGEVDKYSWLDIGSSFLPSDMNAAFLLSQLEEYDFIQNGRMKCWDRYAENLDSLAAAGHIEIPFVPQYAKHNAHLFFVKLKDLEERTDFMKYLTTNGIKTAFHYVPLHSSVAGKRYGEFVGKDLHTTKESERLLRLPLFTELTLSECDTVCEKIESYFKS